MVIVLLAHVAVAFGGKPVAAPIPVAPVVVWMIGVRVLLIHNVGEYEAGVTVFVVMTVIVPVALTAAPQPPVNGIE